MAAVGDNNFIRYIYRGEQGEVIPRHVTHVTVAKDVTVVHARACRGHTNIVEVICHDKVENIGQGAFRNCPSLRRVIMPGVKVVEDFAFDGCLYLADVECGKLEIIKEGAFNYCCSLKSNHLNLSSVRIVEKNAFSCTWGFTNVKFSSKLERIEGCAFVLCASLERITIPLKDNLITTNDVFQQSDLKHVDLVEGELHETIAALQLEDWRNAMNEEIDSINRILPNADAGYIPYEHAGYIDEDDPVDYHESTGEKAREIRRWIRSVLRKIIHYQEEHQRMLDEEIATTLQLALPQDIVFNSVLPFLELPSHTFGVEEDEDEDENEASEGSASQGEESEEELG